MALNVVTECIARCEGCGVTTRLPYRGALRHPTDALRDNPYGPDLAARGWFLGRMDCEGTVIVFCVRCSEILGKTQNGAASPAR